MVGEIVVKESRERGMPNKMWIDVNRRDLRECRVNWIMLLTRNIWRAIIRITNPTSGKKTDLSELTFSFIVCPFFLLNIRQLYIYKHV